MPAPAPEAPRIYARRIGDRRLILLTGATGYVGGRLLRALEERGERVRCLSRRPEQLQRPRRGDTEVVRGRRPRPGVPRAALDGVDTVYYLVHSMGSSRAFDEADRAAAPRSAGGARGAGVAKIVYLGGLGSGDLSPHLASRQEVGTDPARLRRPDHRVPRLDRDRLGQRCRSR